jgi:hypothetical protein
MVTWATLSWSATIVMDTVNTAHNDFVLNEVGGGGVRYKCWVMLLDSKGDWLYLCV